MKLRLWVILVGLAIGGVLAAVGSYMFYGWLGVPIPLALLAWIAWDSTKEYRQDAP